MANAEALGIGAACLINGVDATYKVGVRELRNSFNSDSVEKTTFDPARINAYSRDYIQGLLSGAQSWAGLPDIAYSEVEETLKQMLGTKRTAHLVMGIAAPEQESLAIFGRAFQNTWNLGVIRDAIPDVSIDFQFTKDALLAGTLLQPLTGTDTVSHNQTYNLTLAAAQSGSATVTVKNSVGATLGTFSVAPADSTSTVATAIEAVTDIVDVTVTGSTTAPTAGTNWASGKTVSAVTGGGGFTQFTNGNNIFDGSTGSSAGSSGAVADMIDLGTARVIETLKLYANSNTTYTIYGTNNSDGHTGRVLLGTFANTGATAAYRTVTTGTTTPYRYIAVHADGAGTLNEVQVIGPVSGGGGTYGIEFVDPAGTQFILSTSSTGWSVSETQRGDSISAYNIVDGTLSGTAIQDVDAATDKGFEAQINCVYLASGESATWIIEHAPDSSGTPGTWATLVSFTELDAVGAERVSVAAGTSINPWLRAKRTDSGGECVVAIAFWRGL